MNHKVADNFTLPRVIGTSLSLCCSQETRRYPKGAERVQPPITGPEVDMTSHHHSDILSHYSLEMFQFLGYQYTTKEGKNKVRVVKTPQPTNLGVQLSVEGDITLQIHQFATKILAVSLFCKND